MEILREALPILPFDWDKECSKQPGRVRKSYSFFNLDEVCSAAQKSARRGWQDDCRQWFLEMFWVNKATRTMTWNRLLIICFEDIGPGNPEAFLKVYHLYKSEENNPSAVIKAADIVSGAEKTRVNDWASHYIYHFGSINENDFNSNSMNYNSYLYQKLVDALTKKDLVDSLLNCHYLAQSPLRLNTDEKKLYNTRYKNSQWLILCALKKVIGDNYYLKMCQELAISNNWRWKSASIMIYFHCIHLWIYGLFPTLTSEITEDLNGYQEIVEKYKNRVDLLGMPDLAIDKHTLRGKERGRGSDHFIKEGGILNNRSLYWKKLDEWYLEQHLSFM